jgi:hypothetical protein
MSAVELVRRCLWPTFLSSVLWRESMRVWFTGAGAWTGRPTSGKRRTSLPGTFALEPDNYRVQVTKSSPHRGAEAPRRGIGCGGTRCRAQPQLHSGSASGFRNTHSEQLTLARTVRCAA